MATAIKNTSVLKEESSIRFNRLIEQKQKEKITPKEKKRIKELESVKNIKMPDLEANYWIL